jgi:hypothetical protein
MMKIPLSVSPERFTRSFQKTVPQGGLLSRFSLTDKTLCRGKIGKRGFSLYLHKKGIFSLFAPTLYGKIKKEEKGFSLSFYFSRPRLTGALILLWCAFLVFTGVLLVGKEPLFSLCFLLPGILFSLPLFLFRKKDREALVEKLESLSQKSSLAKERDL